MANSQIYKSWEEFNIQGPGLDGQTKAIENFSQSEDGSMLGITGRIRAEAVDTDNKSTVFTIWLNDCSMARNCHIVKKI